MSHTDTHSQTHRHGELIDHSVRHQNTLKPETIKTHVHVQRQIVQTVKKQEQVMKEQERLVKEQEQVVKEKEQ